MQDIEREAMDIQLHDKLLAYKQQMGLLGPASTDSGKQISAGTSAPSEEQVLDQVLLNEAGEANKTN
jgi:hypothetical protein